VSRRLSCLVLALAALPAAATAEPPPLLGLTVHPDSVEFHGPRARHRLGVLGEYADGTRRDFSREATCVSADSSVASIGRDGMITPHKDGETTVTVRVGGVAARVTVRVRGTGHEEPVNFVREVVPVLTRAGCNAGACHGALHGKNGFRLSLFGFDPGFDYREMVQSARGRRAVAADPDGSLVLLKPTGRLEHGGGRRFTENSPLAGTLRRWLEDSAPPPAEGDPRLKDLDVWPRSRLLRPGETQQLLVRAAWDDGRVEDVTPLAKFDSLNDAVAAVDADGLVKAAGKGETHIMVRFGGLAKVMRITLPYAPPPAEAAPTWGYVDEKLTERWAELGLVPSPVCSDAEFLRRLHLDVLGTQPTPDEVRRFLADGRPDKRARAVDAALDRPEFVDFWTLKWGDWLRVNRDLVTYKGMLAYHGWLRRALQENRPADALAREILTATGGNFEVGPANWYLTARSPEDLGESAAQLFLGVRMQCARCHRHPFEKWTQEDYCGLAAFFARVGTRAGKRSDPSSGSETEIFVRDSGDVTHPRMDRYVPPHVPDGPPLPGTGDRRRHLADWLTTPDNSYFARNLANRYWAALMGRGLVEPADDLRATNPPSIPALLDALADDLVKHHYDTRHLLRTILLSRAYQLAAVATPANAADAANAFFTRRTPRRMSAEQLADAIDDATGTREAYPGAPPGTRAIQLPDTRVRSFLLDLFGRPARQAPCDCERSAQPNVAQALHLLNGDFLEHKIADRKGRVARLVARHAAPADVIEELYLATLSRPPSPDEAARARHWLADAASPAEGAADLLWVLLNSREFLFCR
jgi:hypothetical protein